MAPLRSSASAAKRACSARSATIPEGMRSSPALRPKASIAPASAGAQAAPRPSRRFSPTAPSSGSSFPMPIPSFRARPRTPKRLPTGVDAVLGDTRWQAGAAHFFRLAREAGVPAILDADRAPHERPELLDLATHAAFAAQGLRDLTGLDDPCAGLQALPKIAA